MLHMTVTPKIMTYQVCPTMTPNFTPTMLPRKTDGMTRVTIS